MSPSLFRSLKGTMVRELRTALRHLADVLNPMAFFIIVTSLFPLGVGPEPNMLRAMGPGVLWVAALLATMIALHRMFDTDYEDGSLELMALSPYPLTLTLVAKVFAHWLLTGLPLVILSPLLAMQLQLPWDTTKILVLTLLLGTPALTFIGAIAAALTVGLRGGGVLVSLLVLPLYTPVLIFGASAVSASLTGLEPDAHISLLAAILALAISLSPVAIAAAIRISLD